VNSPISKENNLSIETQKLALQLHSAGRFTEAEALFRRLITNFPDSAELYKNYGNTLLSLERFDEAEEAYRQALAIKNDYAAAFNNLGNILLITKRLEEADQAFQQALRLMPDNAEICNNYGNLLMALENIQGAEQAYYKSTLLDPTFAMAYYNHARSLMFLGRLQDTEKEYRKAITLNPNYYEACCNLGDLLIRLERQDEAETILRQTLEIKPDLVEAHNNLGNVLSNIGRLDEAIDSYRRALEIKPDSVSAYSNLLLCLNYTSTHNDADKLEVALQYGRMVASKVNKRFTTWNCLPAPKRLKVGLVSGDFRNHPVGYFLEGVIANIDFSRIEFIAYPTNYEVDELTVRIKPFFSTWKPLAGLNDKAAADLIHSDGVHLLIDLSGHTMHNRLPIFSWKPAPVQLTWLGYLATTGIAEIDYIIGDNQATPPENDWQYSESVWRLPDLWACFTPPVEVKNISPLPALSAGCITFGCFNNLSKMNDSIVCLWSKILLAVPGSYLFLKTKQLGNPKVSEGTRRRFSAHGVAPDRLILEGASPRTELLLAYNRVDIALDPYPYGGGTTTFELLSMSVPVITRKGNSFLSRCGQSIVYNAGLDDWIAADDDDYVAKAIEHSRNINKLAILRANLRQQVLSSPLFDALRFARHFEDALHEIWSAYENNIVPKLYSKNTN